MGYLAKQEFKMIAVESNEDTVSGKIIIERSTGNTEIPAVVFSKNNAARLMKIASSVTV